ncbi:hypothetical protein HUG20_13310 [Salicibibacter cibi]|uniref:Uncharacterized protein n=1 Tax=Salicibibacter cibi TaxID=2743001 RepID=A0A7T6ZC46_9BACI|nr:hypothetical protein [Salicibibacter cibi]QQK80776.1 hypothetical protein HUG20_13310 [Salicibibacter cibi]
MGYVPMQHNDVASQYRNRVQAAPPLIKANPPIDRVRAKRVGHYHKRDGQPFPSRVYVTPYHRHESESKLTGKGHRFDAMA